MSVDGGVQNDRGWMSEKGQQRLNEKERALENLEKAYAQHSMSLTGAKVDPVYDSLRNERRFQTLLERMHLTT